MFNRGQIITYANVAYAVLRHITPLGPRELNIFGQLVFIYVSKLAKHYFIISLTQQCVEQNVCIIQTFDIQIIKYWK